MSLARELGYPSRRAMYADMTAADLREWEKMYEVAPWGVEHDELLHGIMCGLIDACHRAKGQPEPPIHYMPNAKSLEGEPQQSEEQMREIMETVTASWGS